MVSLAICANNSLQRPELPDTLLSTVTHHKCDLAIALRLTVAYLKAGKLAYTAVICDADEGVGRDG